MKGPTIRDLGIVFAIVCLLAVPAFSQADAYEEDDKCFQSTLAFGNQTQSHNFEDDTTDYYYFHACPGRTYDLEAFPVGPSANLSITLYSGFCSSILLADFPGPGVPASLLGWSPGAEKNYFVAVKQADSTTGAGREYDFLITGDSSPCSTWSKRLDFGVGPSGILDMCMNGREYPAYNILGKDGPDWLLQSLSLSGSAGSAKVISTAYNETYRNLDYIETWGMAAGLQAEGTTEYEGWPTNYLYTDYFSVGLDDGAGATEYGPGVFLEESLFESIQSSVGGVFRVERLFYSADVWTVWYKTISSGVPVGEPVFLLNLFSGDYVAGSWYNNAGSDVLQVEKFDADGVGLWKNRYDGWLHADAASVTPDGGFAVAGQDDTLSPVLAKIASDGTLEWSFAFEDLVNEGRFRAVVTAVNGDILASGFQNPTGSLFTRFDSSGNLLWQKTLSGVPDVRSAVRGSDGGVLYGCDPGFTFYKTDLSGIPSSGCAPQNTALSVVARTPGTVGVTPDSPFFVGRWDLGEFMVSSSSQSSSTLSICPPFLSYDSHIFSDCGNGDSLADPGETLTIDVTVYSEGSLDAFNVSGILSSTTPGVTVIQANSAYPDIPVGQFGNSLTAFEVEVGAGVACGTVMDFTVDLSYEDSLAAPYSNPVSCQITIPAVCNPDVCPPPVPGEISSSGAVTPLSFSDSQTLGWEDGTSSGADSFNLYRGDISTLPSSDYGTCIQPALAASTALDATAAPPGTAWFYLVTGVSAAGEGTMGYDSSPGERPNSNPCP